MTHDAHILPREDLQRLIAALQAAGYRCLGPQVRDHAILYGPLEHAQQLPRGVRVEQTPGAYRLRMTSDTWCFAWANGPQALKPQLFAPREILWRAQRSADGRLSFVTESASSDPIAIIGVRACDLAALALQDQHFLAGPHPDPHYHARRLQLFVVAVNCSHPADTCFCVSTGDGPSVTQAYDLALTELETTYLLRSGSDRGEAVLHALDLSDASSPLYAEEAQQHQAAVAAQRRQLPGRDLKNSLFSALNHARWDDVAQRCLSCGNCTQVCPTCFCHSTSDVPRLDATHSEHIREWDSCFTAGHSYMHGYQVRADTRTRYRQWLTHKLGSWHDQYGRSGCVGCGRCIAWCPVGIDITEEASAICAPST